MPLPATGHSLTAPVPVTSVPASLPRPDGNSPPCPGLRDAVPRGAEAPSTTRPCHCRSIPVPPAAVPTTPGPGGAPLVLAIPAAGSAAATGVTASDRPLAGNSSRDTLHRDRACGRRACSTRPHRIWRCKGGRCKDGLRGLGPQGIGPQGIGPDHNGQHRNGPQGVATRLDGLHGAGSTRPARPGPKSRTGGAARAAVRRIRSA